MSRQERAIAGQGSRPRHSPRCGRHVAAAALAFVVSAAVAHAQTPVAERAGPPVVAVLDVEGAIGVATSEFIERGFARARSAGAGLIVLRLDTPGGLVSSTRVIIRAMLSSAIPVAVHVTPAGARAASAGTYMIYAAHVAAMSPGTHLGAATPISLNSPLPGGNRRGEKDKEKEKDESGKKDSKKDDAAEGGSAAERKVINDAAAYLRALAQLRGRNADWAERAVRSAATLTASEAVKENVVDLLARDTADLLDKVDGRTVALAGGETRLATRNARIVEIAPDWRIRLLAVIGDPNIAYLLLLIGFYGLLFEIYSPGMVGPGVLGAICLLLGLGSLSVLPVDYAGLALLVLGIGFMAAEVLTPGLGVLGLGGVVAFVAGSVLLFDPEGARGIDFGVAWPVIAAAALVSGGFFVLVLGLAMRARRRPVVSGRERMIGSRAVVVTWDGQEGTVRAQGEIWNARARESLAPGAAVRVVGLEGLRLTVAPLPEPSR